MKYFKYLILAMALISMLFASQSAEAQAPEPVWNAQFFNNAFLGEPAAFTQQTQQIAYDWGLGSPGAGIDADEFSARWATDATFEAGTYRFWVLADDNVSITIDFRNTIIDTFETGQVDEVITADITLSEGSHHIQVDYRELSDEAFIYVDFANIAENPTPPDFTRRPTSPVIGGAWTVEYYANQNLTGNPRAILNDDNPSENWGTGSAIPSLPVNNWSARWTSTIALDGGNYEVSARADDGVRVYVDGILIIDEWHQATGETYRVTRNLARGNHTFVIEYYENLGLAQLEWNLTRITAVQPTPPVDDETTATVTAFRLNVRDAPDVTRGNVITRISRGETYPVLSFNTNRTWAQISLGNTLGWVSTNFINIEDADNIPITTPDAPQTTGFIVTATPFTVNIRTGPGTRFNDIGNLPSGDTAQVIGRNAEATWWQINYEGIEGWVSAQYALLEAGANITDIPITNP